jgi:hypothetical protein
MDFGIDYCTKEGAYILAVRIRDYWKVRGWRVEVFPEIADETRNTRNHRYDLRSDMVGGLPRGCA